MINYCSTHPDVSDGDDIIREIEDAQASHIFQGFPTAARDINPRFVVLENGIVNRSRWFCNLNLAGRLRTFYGLTVEQSEAFAPVVASQPLDDTADYADDLHDLGAGAADAIGGVYQATPSIVQRPCQLRAGHQ